MGQAQAGSMQVVSRAASILRALDGEHRGPQPVRARRADRPATLDRPPPRDRPARRAPRRRRAGDRPHAPGPGARAARRRQPPASSRTSCARTSRTLHRRLDETIGLSVLDGDGVRFVDQITANHPLQAVTAVGEVLPAWSSASGRALLADAARRGARRARARHPRRPRAHDDDRPPRVLAAISRAARDGLAVTREEYTEGVCAVAVAVRDALGARRRHLRVGPDGALHPAR